MMDKVKYYQFWLYQYVKRNQEYIDAFNLITDPNGDNSWPGLDEAEKLVRSFGFMDPHCDAYRKGKFWLRDEVNNFNFFAFEPLTAEKILETLLAVREAQGCRGNVAIKCNYIVPHLSFFKIQETLPSLPENEDLKKMEPKEIARRFEFYQAIAPERVDNALKNAGEDKRSFPYSLNRAIGLVLYDLLIVEKSKANAVLEFLRRYGEIDDKSGDSRLPASYRKNNDNLYKPLRNAIKCIENREVLPME